MTGVTGAARTALWEHTNPFQHGCLLSDMGLKKKKTWKIVGLEDSPALAERTVFMSVGFNTPWRFSL